jgi:HK97 family phage portal protein
MLKALSKLFSSEKVDLPDFSQATPAERAMLSRIAFGKKERDFIEYNLKVPINKFTDYSSYIEVGTKRVWASFRACKLIASALMSASFRIYQDRGGRVDITKNLGWFLKRPNPFDSWEEMVEMWVFHMELTGNAYWLKDEIDLKGRPKYIYPLLPQYMKVTPDRKMRVAEYVYTVNGVETKFAPSEIIHFRGTNPASLIMGMGSIEPAETIYNEYINKSTLNEKFVQNGAQLSGILTRETEIDDEDQWAALKRKFNLEYSGNKNAGKVAFLNGKWQYHRLGLTMEEMQSIEKDRWTMNQIFLNHGVPLSVAGIENAAAYGTAKQDEVNFRRYKIVPMLDLLIGKLNADGFINVGDDTIRLAYEMSGLVDIEQVIREYGPLVDKGAMTPNELRELCNLPLIDNPLLDQFYMNAGRVPLELVGVGSYNGSTVAPVAIENTPVTTTT